MKMHVHSGPPQAARGGFRGFLKGPKPSAAISVAAK
eukprot:CAMPEP_0115879016 /NCGR_PEP_ID=MMETSP0287-20121206/27091_1 /TAXON_ID=412157 /ORGANISM="Chrysochromulina rotalis, Strain UIO044" /LENGTH=35 /DNA_ID= /DNA_START= /DNA_END= /DNA_ORIENTATION=